MNFGLKDIIYIVVTVKNNSRTFKNGHFARNVFKFFERFLKKTLKAVYFILNVLTLIDEKGIRSCYDHSSLKLAT